MCFGNQNFLRKKTQNQTLCHTIPRISDALTHLFDHSKCEMSPCIPVRYMLSLTALVALKRVHMYFVGLVGGIEIPNWSFEIPN